ncbi:MAG: chromosomal replication initiator protein, partial [Frankiaceae bacterium]|nr:chromosomal replication initiator protein [Frankiaceae bacterium]
MPNSTDAAATPEIDLDAVWTRAIAELGDDVLPAQHRAWMRLTKPLALVQDTAVLAAPNDFARDVLDTKLRDVIVAALSRQLGQDVRVAVTVEPDSAPPADEPLPAVEPASPMPAASTQRPLDPVAGGSRLNPKYQFDTFVIGSSNRFAHAAAVAVAEAPAKAYNPLFIYGESGLGKTHLLHAIGHYTQHLFNGHRV